jgi:hypothetical protein
VQLHLRKSQIQKIPPHFTFIPMRKLVFELYKVFRNASSPKMQPHCNITLCCCYYKWAVVYSCITLQDRIATSRSYTCEGNCEWILQCTRVASIPLSTEWCM